MKIIGLTGGIASGKSTVSALLQEKGYAVIDADKIARQLAEPYQPLWQEYKNRYGSKVLHEDKSLNRQAVADIVFAEQQERKWMDAMAHPIIRAEISRHLVEIERQGCKIVFLDVPLLYESGWDAMADIIWVIYVSPEKQVQRLCSRNGFSVEEAKRRIGVQMSMEEKKAKAGAVIDNNGNLEQLRQQVFVLLEDFEG